LGQRRALAEDKATMKTTSLRPHGICVLKCSRKSRSAMNLAPALPTVAPALGDAGSC